MSKLYNICVKKTFKGRNGVEKTHWPQVGTMRVNDDGKMFIELPILNQSFYVFEAKARNEAVAKSRAPDHEPGFDDDLPN